MKQFIFFCCLMIPALFCFAQTDDELAFELAVNNLSYDSQWLALGMYQKDIFGRYKSEIDDDKFFLSTKGKHSPKEELLATINAFKVNINTTTDEKNISCRFPARHTWLLKNFPSLKLKTKSTCSEFLAWKEKIDAQSATLIYPAAYIDSPSSMFGHTFLRLNQANQNAKNKMLAYTINYAGKKLPNESELSFVYKGLVGGYPGEIAIVPYYIKLKEYRDMESRDIWEYELNLSKPEIDLLVAYIWEVKDIAIDYYFFSENCSYRILNFLDTVRPQHQLSKNIGATAIPIDTVRLLREKNYISSIDYRPSIRTYFDSLLEQTTKKDRQTILNWVNHNQPITTEQTTEQTTEKTSIENLLKVSYEYSRITPFKNKNNQQVSYNLLKKMSQIKTAPSFIEQPRPDKPDEYGHDSKNISIAYGQENNKNTLTVTLRPAYHELTDPPHGYPAGSELKFGELVVKYREQDKWLIDNLTIVGIQSLKPSNAFFRPKSWKVRLGATEVRVEDEPFLTGLLEGAVGKSYQLSEPLLSYALIGSDLRLATDYNDNADIGLTAEFGALGRTRHSQYQLNFIARQSLLNNQDTHYSASIKKVINFTPNFTLKLAFDRNYNSGNYFSEYSVALSSFF